MRPRFKSVRPTSGWWGKGVYTGMVQVYPPLAPGHRALMRGKARVRSLMARYDRNAVRRARRGGTPAHIVSRQFRTRQ